MANVVGLYNKYTVWKPANCDIDRNYALCEFFILDINHDPLAMNALKAYHDAWQQDNIESTFFSIKQPQFLVERNRKSDRHKNCCYFVLDACHDRYAIPALRKYKWDCLKQYPLLAQDLIQLINRHEGKYDEQHSGD